MRRPDSLRYVCATCRFSGIVDHAQTRQSTLSLRNLAVQRDCGSCADQTVYATSAQLGGSAGLWIMRRLDSLRYVCATWRFSGIVDHAQTRQSTLSLRNLAVQRDCGSCADQTVYAKSAQLGGSAGLWIMRRPDSLRYVCATWRFSGIVDHAQTRQSTLRLRNLAVQRDCGSCADWTVYATSAQLGGSAGLLIMRRLDSLRYLRNPD